MRNHRHTRNMLPLLRQLENRCLLSGATQPQTAGYTPAQITRAYGLNAITFRSTTGSTIKGNGAGQTIALIEEYHDPYIESDLRTFDSKYNLPLVSLTVVNQAGNQTNNSWALEESMDVEYAHAIAPGARLLVVEAAPSNSQKQELQNQLNAVNTARNTTGVVAISMSWGYNETTNEASYDKYFTTPSGHKGITFIASSGDLGLSEYPAASPNVLSVGGTSLSITSSGNYESETAWFYSGGSYSPYSRSRVIRDRCKRQDSGPRPTWPSTPTQVRASRFTRPRRVQEKDRGKSMLGQAWGLQPGRGSSPSSTRAGLSPAKGVWTVPPRPCPLSTRFPRATFTA